MCVWRATTKSLFFFACCCKRTLTTTHPQKKHQNNRLIHLPLFDFLLGFPLQLLGLLAAPYLAVRYLVDGESASDDVGKAVVRG